MKNTKKYSLTLILAANVLFLSACIDQFGNPVAMPSANVTIAQNITGPQGPQGPSVNTSGLVPYIGADNSLNIGTYNITTTSNISAGNFYTSAIGWFNQFLINLSGNITSLIATDTNLSGNLSANYTAWTQNDSNLSSNFSLKLNTSNVTTTPTSGKVPSANSSARLNGWIDRGVAVTLFSPNITVTAQNETKIFVVPALLDSQNITAVWAGVSTNSTSGNVTVQIWNVRQASIVAVISIDANEGTSYTAAVAPTITTAKSGLLQGDIIRYDVIYAGTGAKGLQVGFVCGLP